ncbi:MAG TPA: hypothetical protein VMU94_31455 [Streptosporangiaceae bacterium]|nr:hypothetical protein [Streptosporangiaceae bacterium]
MAVRAVRSRRGPFRRAHDWGGRAHAPVGENGRVGHVAAHRPAADAGVVNDLQEVGPGLLDLRIPSFVAEHYVEIGEAFARHQTGLTRFPACDLAQECRQQAACSICLVTARRVP